MQGFQDVFLASNVNYTRFSGRIPRIKCELCEVFRTYSSHQMWIMRSFQDVFLASNVNYARFSGRIPRIKCELYEVFRTYSSHQMW